MEEQFSYLKKLSLLYRRDIFPWVPFYAVYIYLAMEHLEEIVGRLIFIGLMLMHGLFCISAFWSKKMEAFIGYKKVSKFEQATHVFVTKERKQRKPVTSICKLDIGKTDGEWSCYVDFQKKKFSYEREAKKFTRIRPNILRPMNTFKKVDNNIIENTKIYGTNRLEIPFPSFGKLLKEQLVEPFSFFQFFSVSLWLLDENRLYSLFTLGLLLMTSCTVVMQVNISHGASDNSDVFRE